MEFNVGIIIKKTFSSKNYNEKLEIDRGCINAIVGICVIFQSLAVDVYILHQYSSQ